MSGSDGSVESRDASAGIVERFLRGYVFWYKVYAVAEKRESTDPIREPPGTGSGYRR